MSKKASVCLASVTAIAASSDTKVIVGIVIVAVVAILTQALIDLRNK